MNMTAPPRVLSVSWGNGESGFDADHMQATNREFAKMGLSGITILAVGPDSAHGGCVRACGHGWWGAPFAAAPFRVLVLAHALPPRTFR